jgi:hypothetical protein
MGVERVSVDDCAPQKDLGGSRNSVPPRSIYAICPTRVPLPSMKVDCYRPLSKAESGKTHARKIFMETERIVETPSWQARSYA